MVEKVRKGEVKSNQQNTDDDVIAFRELNSDCVAVECFIFLYAELTGGPGGPAGPRSPLGPIGPYIQTHREQGDQLRVVVERYAVPT